MSRPRPVVGLGLCAIDHLLVVEGPALTGERTRYERRLITPGGMIGTALAQAAALGCRTRILSAVGEDDEGRALVRGLRAAGVGTGRLLALPGFPTCVAYVLVDPRSGERRFIVQARAKLERGLPGFDHSIVRRGTVLLIDGHFPVQAMRAVRRAREVGATVIADFSDSRPGFHRLLPYVDLPVVPEEFVRTWGVGDAPATLRALHERYGGTPVVTQGRRGALALLAGRLRRVPSPKVRVRDTTGAGDCFHGALAAGLAHGRDLLSALHLAARAGARACTALGGQSRLLKSRGLAAT